MPQLPYDNIARDGFEVEYLAAREDGGKYLLLLGGSHDEDDILGWLLQRFEEGVERRRREHVHLVDDIDFVTPYLGRNVYLLDELAYVVGRVVGGCVHLKNVERTLLCKGSATITLSARLATCKGRRAIDGSSKNTGCGGLPDPSWAAKKIGVRRLLL